MKQEKVKYPIFAKLKNKSNILIMKFEMYDDEGFAVFTDDIICEVGEYLHDLDNHQDLNAWQILDYDADRNLYDTQPILCWDNRHTTQKEIRFYDAKNRAAFDVGGERSIIHFDNYKALTNQQVIALQEELVKMYMFLLP